MVGVQILFGLIGEIFPSDSLPAVLALVFLGLLVASACGAFVAKRSFAIAAVVVLTLDFVLCFFALRASYSFSVVVSATWPLFCGGLISVVLGAKLGELVARRFGTAATT
jgi:hypothetical protein